MTISDHPSEYLRFRKDPTYTGRTERWFVVSKRSDDVLGTIRWWGAWRQYVFEPSPATVFNVGCMEDISGAIEKLMVEWRRQRSMTSGTDPDSV